jgi:hypothetical protein
MKGILTKEQIMSIQNEANHHIYRIQGVVSFSIASENPFGIHKITPKGLIFIQGTDDTGFIHINKRHSAYSNDIYWNNFYDHKGDVIEKENGLGRKKHKLDNPSRFNPMSIPIFDYLKIADEIFEESNLNIEDNKNKDLFDVFDGIPLQTNNDEVKYRLITYKNSKIVHTLFPLSKKYNKQVKLLVNFARDNPKSKHNILRDDFQIEIQYKDEYQIVRYIIIIREDPQNNNREQWYIQINAPNGYPFVTEHFGDRVKGGDFKSEIYLRKLEVTDLTQFEKRIKKIEKDTFS